MFISKEFSTYGWLFWTQHFLHSATIGWLEKKKERKKERKKEEEEEQRRRWTIPSFDHFRLATLEQFLYAITAAVDWGSLYKLF